MTDETIGGAPLTDDELAELGKAVGTLAHRLMRARQDNADVGTISVLSTLAKCGPMRASELAPALMLDLSTVSRHVQHLERSGLIEKVADPTDRRAMTLHVTAEGKGHIEDLWRSRIALMREGLEHWDPEDLRTFSRLLNRYADDFTAIISRAYDEKHGKTTEEGH